MSNVSFYSSTTKCTNIGPVLLPIVLPSNVSIYGNTTECTGFGDVLGLLLVHTHFLHHYCTYSVCSVYAAFITVNTFSITEQILSIVAGRTEMNVCDSALHAIDHANKRGGKAFGASGVGAIQCRHMMVLANGVGDLQKGERYYSVWKFEATLIRR